MSTIKDNNFIVIQGWMINELGLSGDELLIYAILYGFSQGGDFSTQIDIKYLADWTNECEYNVELALVSLESKGLLENKNNYEYKTISPREMMEG